MNKEHNYHQKNSVEAVISFSYEGKDYNITMANDSEGDYTQFYGHAFETNKVAGLGAFFDGEEKVEAYYEDGQSGTTKFEKADGSDEWEADLEDEDGAVTFISSVVENEETIKAAKLEETADGYQVTFDLEGIDPSAIFGTDTLEDITVKGTMVMTFTKDAFIKTVDAKDVKVEGASLAKDFIMSGEDSVSVDRALDHLPAAKRCPVARSSPKTGGACCQCCRGYPAGERRPAP